MKAPHRPLLTNAEAADWFENATGRRCPVDAIMQPLTRKLNLHLSCAHFSDSLNDPKFQLFSGAMNDANKAANQLKDALSAAQRSLLNVGEPEVEIDTLLNCLENAFEKGVFSPAQTGRRRAHWELYLLYYGREVLTILRESGTPRASMTSAGGPAPKLMASVIEWCDGSKVAPGTIADRCKKGSFLKNRFGFRVGGNETALSH